eukprot:16431526-Heterocapsa_arctica.AAC.1
MRIGPDCQQTLGLLAPPALTTLPASEPPHCPGDIILLAEGGSLGSVPWLRGESEGAANFGGMLGGTTGTDSGVGTPAVAAAVAAAAAAPADRISLSTISAPGSSSSSSSSPPAAFVDLAAALAIISCALVLRAERARGAEPPTKSFTEAV